jgi:hypothetical protein
VRELLFPHRAVAWISKWPKYEAQSLKHLRIVDEGAAFAVGRKLAGCSIFQTLYDSLAIVKELVLDISKM